MMITIHGLPPKTTFQAVKTLVKQECNIIDFILDNLVDDGPNAKKVRIGVSDDAEGYRIIKYLNGFRMSPSHLLKIVPVGKPLNPPPQQHYDQRPSFPNQPRNEYPNQSQSRPDYPNLPMDNYNQGPHIPLDKDTRKGNYVPPNMRKKILSRDEPTDHRDTAPLMAPEIRPHSLGQMRHDPHGSANHPGSHSMGARGQDTRHPMPQGQDMMNSQWRPDGGPSSNEWRPPGQGNMQGPSTYNQRPNQGVFGQQQHPQGPQESYVQGRGPPAQGFGYQHKPAVLERVAPPQQRESRLHVLRTVEIVDTPQAARQYPQEKSITIMKENFQGPAQYGGAPSQHGDYATPGQQPVPVWQTNPQSKSQYNDRLPIEKRADAPRQDYDKRGHFAPIGGARPTSPSRPVPPTSRYQEPGRRSPNKQFPERRVSPSRLGPPVMEFSSSGRRISPGSRFSPRRKISPARGMSPGRRYSPGRKISPGRKMSPGRRFSPGRKMSPGRRISPGRKMSPGRRYSPGRKISPGRRDDTRRISPSMMHYDYYVEDERRMVRRDSPRHYSTGRQSPTRRLVSPPRTRFSPSRLGDKPSDKFLDDSKGQKPVRPAYEPSQAPNQSYTGGYRDTVPYSARQEARPSPWQNEKIMYPSSAKEEDRRDMARRLDKPTDKSPGRMSRSPIKDRYRRHSPSPRSSRSPRRSWALEKRSPDAVREPPPPPVWPGQNSDLKQHKPTRFGPPPQETKHANVWERLDEPRPFQEKIRVRSDLDEKFPPTRREFAESRDYREDGNRKQMDRDREFHRSDDRTEFRSPRQSPRRDDRMTAKKVFNDIDKDFQDIYKRAVEFRKKTEERQKSGESRREEFEDRHKAEERYRREPTPRRSRSRSRGHDWDIKHRKRIFLSPTVKAKRDKAVEEITNRIIDKYDVGGDHKYRVTEELRVTLYNVFMEMFSEKDVSFIELVIKYQAKYPPKEEEKLIQDVLSRLPSHYRNMKRKAAGEDASETPAKTSRRSPPRSSREENERPKLSDSVIPEWNTKLEPPKVMTMSLSVAPAVNLAAPVMVPPPVYVPTHVEMPNVYNQQLQYSNSPQHPHFSGNQMQQQYVDSPPQFANNQQQFSVNQQQFVDNHHQFANNQQQYTDNQQYDHDTSQHSNEGYNLYLCQDDFEPFSSVQANYLKNFLYNEIVKVTETSNGWAPDIILKGLQSLFRYELSTKDERSKDWVLNLNFAEFEYFNVLVYTKEELWYERAAIWLPGHSRSRAVEPLDKLKMQNKQLEGVNIGKWKFVKKVVTQKGTRLYVDMPPSSARALEKHKMMLSYELQKVNVFLKAVAVDKDVFDAGLKEISITDPSLLTSAVQNSPMPTLNANSEPGIVKIGLNGHKSLTVEQARKIKEVVVYHLIKYLQQCGSSKTDFIKFGFCQPNFIGIVPENSESKKWLLSRSFGKMNRTTIVVFGDENDHLRYFKMFAVIPHEYHSSAALAFERLKQSNQGIKGIHFNLWKPIKLTPERKKVSLELDVDLESVEALSRMKYKLDYVGEFGIQVVNFHSEYSFSKLEEKIKKCKLEQVDSYDVANMELDSDSDKDDDVVCVN